MLLGFIDKLFKKNILFSLLAFIGAVVMSLIIYSPQIPLNLSLVLNQPAPFTVTAPQFIEFQSDNDKLRTRKLIEHRKSLIEPIYSIDETVIKDITEKIILFFNQIREIKLKNNDIEIDFLTKNELTFLLLYDQIELTNLESVTLISLKELLQVGIRDINYQTIDSSLGIFLNNYYPDSPFQIISKIIKQFIKPNLLINSKKTEANIQKQIQTIQPFYTTFKTDETIILKGEIVTNFHLNILQQMNLVGSKANILNFVGILITCIFLFILFERFIYFFYIKLHKNISTYLLTYILLLIIILISRAFLAAPAYRFIDNLNFLIPISVFVILLSLLLTPNIAMLSGTIAAILISSMYNFDMFLFLFLFISSCVTTLSCYKLFKRSDLIKAGNIIGLINIIMIFAIGIMSDITSLIWFLYNGIIGFSNGLLCAMLSFAFLPYLESLFKITTSLGLLENANLNHPLLKKLMMNAPGTYQHSLMVANLSEAAAEAIGADVVLSRIGGYFHDIGKMKRPIFFSENQFSGSNPHNNISPRMSKMVISAHTKDGVELAQKYKLPKVLQDFILEHHGTTLVSFFYSIAKQEEHFDDSDSSREEFRYAGPKPQTKESGILMLADSTEATIRSLEKPTLTKIESLIDKIFLNKITDDQLSQSGLSLNDISLIKTTFLSIFKSIYHNRLDYDEEMTKIINQTKSKNNTDL